MPRSWWALCALLFVVGCNVSVTKPPGGDIDGDGRVGFSDLDAPRSEVAYAPVDTRSPEQRLDDHMDRQKGGREYERDRRNED